MVENIREVSTQFKDFDCYLCPANEILSYSTTNRDGYREYKRDPKICEHCPYLNRCTRSQAHVKVVTCHVWQDAVDEADANRCRYALKDLYKYRKETIERIFGLARELHGFRYTQQFGKAQMEGKAALTYACLNLKKLAKKQWKTRPVPSLFQLILDFFFKCSNNYAANPLSASAESGFVYGLKHTCQESFDRCVCLLRSFGLGYLHGQAHP